MLAETVIKLARIEEPIAKGLALGTSAHAIGTAKAMELGEIEGAMSSLAIAVAGLLTAAAVAGSLLSLPHVRYMQATVPPLPFADGSFDFVISFQVIEHIRRDVDFVREVHRVLRPGGQFIVTTPNAPMSLTRNPWHVREYTADELRDLLARSFSAVEMLGVAGNDRVMAYYEQNRRSVARITRFDILDLQHRLPRRLLQLPYDILNRINRRKLLKANTDLTSSIRMEDYRICPVSDDCFDLFYVAEK